MKYLTVRGCQTCPHNYTKTLTEYQVQRYPKEPKISQRCAMVYGSHIDRLDKIITDEELNSHLLEPEWCPLPEVRRIPDGGIPPMIFPGRMMTLEERDLQIMKMFEMWHEAQHRQEED